MSDRLLQLLSDGQTVSQSSGGALAIALFDGLLTFDIEVSYIWRAPWSLTKTLYVLSRYLGFLNLCIMSAVFSTSHISTSLCEVWLWYFYVGIFMCSLAPCNLLLALRLYGLFLENRNIRVLVMSLYTCELLLDAIVLSLLCSNITVLGPELVPPSLPVMGCVYSVRAPYLFVLCGIPSLVLTLTYFILALQKFLQHVRERSNMQGLRTIRESGTLTSLLSLVFRDGLVFYALIFGGILTNALVFGVIKNRLTAEAAFPWLVATYSIVGSRIVLMFDGNPSNPIGIYKEGIELRVDPSRRQFSNEPPTPAERGWPMKIQIVEG